MVVNLGEDSEDSKYANNTLYEILKEQQRSDSCVAWYVCRALILGISPVPEHELAFWNLFTMLGCLAQS